jgi:hypothetical protein
LPHYYHEEIRRVEIGETCDINRSHQNASRILVEKPAGRRTLVMLMQR